MEDRAGPSGAVKRVAVPPAVDFALILLPRYHEAANEAGQKFGLIWLIDTQRLSPPFHDDRQMTRHPQNEAISWTENASGDRCCSISGRTPASTERAASGSAGRSVDRPGQVR